MTDAATDMDKDNLMRKVSGRTQVTLTNSQHLNLNTDALTVVNRIATHAATPDDLLGDYLGAHGEDEPYLFVNTNHIVSVREIPEDDA